MKKVLRIEIEDNGHWGVTDVEAFESTQVENLKTLLDRANSTIATLETDLRIAMTRYREAEKDAGDKASLRSSLREAQEELRKLRATTTPPSERIAELEAELERAKTAHTMVLADLDHTQATWNETTTSHIERAKDDRDAEWIAALSDGETVPPGGPSDAGLWFERVKARLGQKRFEELEGTLESLEKALSESNDRVRKLELERTDARTQCVAAEEQRDETRKVAATLAKALHSVFHCNGLSLVCSLDQIQAIAKAGEWR